MKSGNRNNSHPRPYALNRSGGPSSSSSLRNAATRTSNTKALRLVIASSLVLILCGGGAYVLMNALHLRPMFSAGISSMPTEEAQNGLRDRKILRTSDASLELKPAPSRNDSYTPETKSDLQLAQSLIDEGRAEEGAKLLRKIIAQDPRNEAALLELAMVSLLDLKQNDVAIEYLEKVVEINPRNSLVFGELVNLYTEGNQLDAGYAFFADAQARFPDSPELAYGMGQMLVNLGRDSEAVNFMEMAAQGDDKERVLADLGDIYGRMGAFNKASDAYGRAVSAQEEELVGKKSRGLPIGDGEERLAMLRLDLARVQMQGGQLDRAQESVNQVLSDSPGDAAAMALAHQIAQQRKQLSSLPQKPRG